MGFAAHIPHVIARSNATKQSHPLAELLSENQSMPRSTPLAMTHAQEGSPLRLRPHCDKAPKQPVRMGKGRLLFERSEFSRPRSNSCCFAAVQHSGRALRAPGGVCRIPLERCPQWKLRVCHAGFRDLPRFADAPLAMTPQIGPCWSTSLMSLRGGAGRRSNLIHSQCCC